MALSGSPDVTIREIDTTTGVAATPSGEGAIGGVFRWGPVDKITLVDSEPSLVSRFGKPATGFNTETWFTAASFLAHTNQLYVSRAANTLGVSSLVTANVTAGNTTIPVSNGGGVGANVSIGMKVYGDGIPSSAVVTASNTTAVTLSVAPSASVSNDNLVFFDASTPFTAIANVGAITNPLNSYIVKNDDVWDEDQFNDPNVPFIARYVGDQGNGLVIGICSNPDQYGSVINIQDTFDNGGNSSGLDANTNIVYNVGSSTARIVITPSASLGSNTADFKANLTGQVAANVAGNLSVGDRLEIGSAYLGVQNIKIKNISSVQNEKSGLANTGVSFVDLELENTITIKESYNDSVITRNWEYYDLVGGAPGTSQAARAKGNPVAGDELHIVVVDTLGKFSGVAGQVLQVLESVSRGTDATSDNGTNIFYRSAINEGSPYIYSTANLIDAPTGSLASLSPVTNPKPTKLTMVLGSDGANESNVSIGAIASAYDIFKSEEIDLAAIMQGKARGGVGGEQIANYIIDNIATIRRDALVTVSPDITDVVNVLTGDQDKRVVDYFSRVSSSSFYVSDSGYKYMYDRYNDRFVYVPLNGDTAGLIAKQSEVWKSPAGIQRGQIKNVVKLAFNPSKPQRDYLYRNNVNPVYSIPGQGTVLFGDKTGLGYKSDFQEIGIRRLFNYVEKAIANAHRSLLFEFNDEFTQRLAKNMTDDFLNNILALGGMDDFETVFDSRVNTPEIIQAKEFRGQIYIKARHSINWITLDFVAVRTGLEFSEVIGRVSNQ